MQRGVDEDVSVDLDSSSSALSLGSLSDFIVFGTWKNYFQMKYCGNKNLELNGWKRGDRNTRFFHTSTLIRRNNVDRLLNERGEWVMDNTELKDLAVRFYTYLQQALWQEGKSS